MNFFKDPSSPFTERAKSPFYGSFVLSWLIWNWKILIAIFFLSKEDFDGKNLIDFININYLNIYDSLLIPLSFSAFYIFALPWADYYIIWYSEKIKRKKVDKKIEIGRMHHVEGNLHYDLKLKYEQERTKFSSLENDLNEEKKKTVLLEKMNQEINEQNTLNLKRYNESEANYLLLEDRKNLNNIFQGRWTLHYTDRKKIVTKEEVSVINEDYYIVENNVTTKTFSLKLIDVDLIRNKLSFVKFWSQESGENITPHSIVELNIISNDRLEGFENTHIMVTYDRNKFVAESKGKKITLKYPEGLKVDVPVLLKNRSNRPRI